MTESGRLTGTVAAPVTPPPDYMPAGDRAPHGVRFLFLGSRRVDLAEVKLELQRRPKFFALPTGTISLSGS